jgi:DNA-binding IscR family transcriptional regulator
VLWGRVQGAIVDTLQKTTLAELIPTTTKNKKAVAA